MLGCRDAGMDARSSPRPHKKRCTPDPPSAARGDGHRLAGPVAPPRRGPKWEAPLEPHSPLLSSPRPRPVAQT